MCPPRVSRSITGRPITPVPPVTRTCIRSTGGPESRQHVPPGAYVHGANLARSFGQPFPSAVGELDLRSAINRAENDGEVLRGFRSPSGMPAHREAIRRRPLSHRPPHNARCHLARARARGLLHDPRSRRSMPHPSRPHVWPAATTCRWRRSGGTPRPAKPAPPVASAPARNVRVPEDVTDHAYSPACWRPLPIPPAGARHVSRRSCHGSGESRHCG